MRNIRNRLIVLPLVLILLATFCPDGVMAAPADDSITVTDGGSVVFADHGKTVIQKQTDIFVTPKANVKYYVLSAGYVDVFYKGVDGTPEGSYFRPPYVPGEWVTTVVGSISQATKTELTASNSWKVTIPKVMPGKVYEIRIAAERTGADNVVYVHRFTGYMFNADIENGNMVAMFENSTGSAVELSFIFAVYKGGKLYNIQNAQASAAAEVITKYQFTLNLADYPIGQYSYKVFCWDKDFVPLALAAEFN